MNKKPAFVELEEAIALAYKQTREMADDMRADNNAMRAIPALELGKRETLYAFDAVAPNFELVQRDEVATLRQRIETAFDRQIDTTRDIEEKWLVSLDAIWSLDQIHPNLVAAFNEFRGRFM